MLTCAMNLKNLIKQLNAMTVSDRRILSKRSKVAYTTINNIAYGYTKNPRIKAILAIEKALK